MTASILTPTAHALRTERADLLAEIGYPEAELRDRAEAFLLTSGEQRALRRLDEIDYLLGDR